jgi:UDP-N-acetylglucosamine acyltransferase
MQIHSSAIINSKAEIGKNVSIGPYTIVEEDVLIADDCKIASNVILAAGTRLGNKCEVHHGAVLGTVPQDLKFKGEKTSLEIGEGTVIREYATLNRGTTDHWRTIVGKNCLLMTYSHIAHDCFIGNNVIISNSVNMAGHVVIEDYVGVGGITPIHQFVRIGKHSFIGGGYRVPKDVPPFILAMGEPLRFGGLNVVGLKRRGYDEKTLSLIKKAFKIIYRSKFNVADALNKIENDLELIEEIKYLVAFFRDSERGVIR